MNTKEENMSTLRSDLLDQLVAKDRDWSNEVSMPDTKEILFKGKRGRIIGNARIPGGRGPFPTIMICHGIPGTEMLQDFAINLCNLGFATVCFHYSGSWGSDGDYHFAHCIEDAAAVLDAIEENVDGWYDTGRIFVLGHSLGGMVATHVIAETPFVKGGVIMMPFNGILSIEAMRNGDKTATDMLLNDFAPFLNGLTKESLLKDADEGADRFTLASHAEKLSKKPVLTVGGDFDTVLPRADNIDLLNAAIQSYHRGNLTTKTFPVDHSMNFNRNQVMRDVGEYMVNLAEEKIKVR
jgi:pimeloyl-ACP methyl ester carboxylesterase